MQEQHRLLTSQPLVGTMLKMIWLCLFILAMAPHAQAKTVRIGILGGFGSGYSKAPDNTLSEGPLAGELFIDYTLDDRMVIGVEHQRSASMAPPATSISFTGVETKWYPYTAQPQILPDEKDLKTSVLYMREWAPYVGTGAGFAQSSVLPPVKGQKPAASVDLYINLKGGVDLPVWRNWGGRAELGTSISLGGTGYTTLSYMMIGFYFYL